VRSARHVLSAAALTAVALAGLTAEGGLDIGVRKAAAHTSTSTSDTTPAGPTSAAASSTAAAAAASASPSTTTTTVPAIAGALTSIAAKPVDTSVAGQILELVNAQRTKAGCRTLTLDPRLTSAAAAHAGDMATRNYFNHTSKDGSTFVDRIKEQGYSAPRSENIAAGQPTVTTVMNAWMKSAGHRANIVDCTATQMGAASAQGGSYRIYWVQDFGQG
jgi:uncharacterized protein YkwD